MTRGLNPCIELKTIREHTRQRTQLETIGNIELCLISLLSLIISMETLDSLDGVSLHLMSGHPPWLLHLPNLQAGLLAKLHFYPSNDLVVNTTSWYPSSEPEPQNVSK